MKLNYRRISYTCDNSLPEIGNSEISSQHRGVTTKLGIYTPHVSHSIAAHERGTRYTNP